MPKAQLAKAGGMSFYGGEWSWGNSPGNILISGPLRMHFQHSGAKIRVFEKKTYLVTAHKCCI